MKCPSCGVENAEGRAVCVSCGESLVAGESASKLKAPFEAPPEAADELQKGIAEFKAGNLDEAIGHFRSVIEKDPTNFQAYNYMGGAYYRKKMYPGAVSSFLRAAELNPDVASVHFNLGMACEGNNMVERALASYRRALDVDPNYAKAAQAIQRIQTAMTAPPEPVKVMCANHPNKEAIGVCRECKTPVCVACGQEVAPGPQAFDEDDSADNVMCNRCLYAKADGAPAAVAAPPPKQAAPPPPAQAAPARPGYAPLEEHERPTEKSDVRPIKPPTPRQRGYESQHEATAKRRAALIAEQERRRTRRRIIGAILTVVVLVGAPALYFFACGGIQPGMTRLLPVLPFLGRVSASDDSFAFAPPWGWEKVEPTPQEDLQMRVQLGVLTGRDAREVPPWGRFNALMYKPPASENADNVRLVVMSGQSFGLQHASLERMKSFTEELLGKQASSPLMRQFGAVSIESSVTDTHKQFDSWDLVTKTYVKQADLTLKTHTVIVHTGEYIHVFSFVAPEALYEKYKPMSDVSRKTWAIKTGMSGAVG
jgi:hypothetical protein